MGNCSFAGNNFAANLKATAINFSFLVPAAFFNAKKISIFATIHIRIFKI
ncbi:hypothetical protein MuYL_0605 [Mucilaginibacter xinganensis]|uniref:Uncharacterized protein n=1 Tax=Mucilaginibacter xinganensis TaxID=1234841 RepID=A0A223NS73_9SPHI|nr:hypothetical protein MuYL_0605 [Mucilaginibacter xinganensis]